jgi:hypothetical protein
VKIGKIPYLLLTLEKAPNLRDLKKKLISSSLDLDILRVLLERARLLEELYEEIDRLVGSSIDRIDQGSVSAQEMEVVEFARKFGVVARDGSDGKWAKDLSILFHYMSFLWDYDDPEIHQELVSALNKRRSPKIPRKIRVDAIKSVQQHFKLASPEATRRQLSIARKASPQGLARFCGPIPGGDGV